MVSKRVHFLYMLTWTACLVLVVAFIGLAVCLSQSGVPIDNRSQYFLLGVNCFVLLGISAFVIIVTALALGVYTIVHTHRMMGSAYRITNVLRMMNEGKFQGVLTLRDGDYFREIADEINLMLARHGREKAEAEAAGAKAEAPAEEAEAPAEKAEAPAEKAEAPAEGEAEGEKAEGEKAEGEKAEG
jgi:hypothetical protein